MQNEDYQRSRARFVDAVDRLAALSVRLNGSAARNGRQFWSSVLAAKMALGCMTLDRIVPRTASAESKELWDLSSVAALVRALAENYLVMFWLCIETEERELWEFRIAALTIVDNRARYRLTAEIEGEPEPQDFAAAQAALAERLVGNRFFEQLGERARRDLLRGSKTPFVQDDVIKGLNIDPAMFRKFYRYLSAFVHTGTVSFFRAQQHGRGNGEYNDYEAHAILACMEFAFSILDAAVGALLQLHDGS